jgi:hypothetical protein
MTKKKPEQCPTLNGHDLTDDETRQEIARAAHNGAMVIGFLKALTDCTACGEIALIMALSSMLEHNGSNVETALQLVRDTVGQTELMRLVFDDVQGGLIRIGGMTEAAPTPDKIN